MESHVSELDFSQVSEQIFLGTNLCCDNQAHLGILSKMGVTAEIDLEEEKQITPPKITIYLWLPTKDKTAPTLDQIEAGVALMHSLVKTGKKVYVHCRLGHGRSPTLIAAYFISEGKTLEEAIKIIKAARPEIHLESSQLEVLHEYQQLKA